MTPDHKPSDFNISSEPIPETVCDRILEYHIIPMIAVCNAMAVCVFVSLFSGWRPRWWEYQHGRNGGSQHCFGEKLDGSFDETKKGATDWTCDDFEDNKDQLLELMIEHTEYTRFCVYKEFLHADYKHTKDNKRQLFNYGYDSVINEWKWIFDKFV